jgi:hypothetical protein
VFKNGKLCKEIRLENTRRGEDNFKMNPQEYYGKIGLELIELRTGAKGDVMESFILFCSNKR